MFLMFRFLPNKDPAEELKHRQQYELMVEAARKKGLYCFFKYSFLYMIK